MTEPRLFPVGIETFSEIREKGYIYVDKTEYIHRLVTEGKYYFLSRPRRFGKSLLLSTIGAFFEGRRDLFDGLAISSHEHFWVKHPVFHLNFVNAATASPNDLNALINQHLYFWEKQYGVTSTEDTPAQRFFAVIKAAVEATGRQSVILIDEYDKALVTSLGDELLNRQFREILKPLYGTMKAADRYIRFGIITGVSRFSRLSIFSDINNLSDISLDREFCAVCGITDDEMLRYCRKGINDIAHENGISFDECVTMLKDYYDGYHFADRGPDLYNPFSLMSAFRKKQFGSYWFATGTPTFLIESLRNADIYLPKLLQSEVDVTQIADIDAYGISTVALLFQTGYLTIKSYDKEYDSYTLGLPNREVANGFFKNLLPIYMDDKADCSLSTVRNLCRAVNIGDADEFVSSLQAFLAGIPYDLSKSKPEIYFENNVYIIFKLMGFTVETEYRTSGGRIDLLIKTHRFIYIIELKLNGSAEDAMTQIENKQYALQFADDRRTIYKIGISFSKQTRNIDRWLIVKA